MTDLQQHRYVQWESELRALNRSVKAGIPHMDTESHVAQKRDESIERTGQRLAEILGFRWINELRDMSKWLGGTLLSSAFAEALDGDLNTLEHARKLYADNRVIGDVFSPYTFKIGIAWGEMADVQEIADKLQAVLEEHNYGMTSTRKSPKPRRIVVLDEAHSLYAPITGLQGDVHNISVLVLRADVITDEIAAQLQSELNAGVGSAC